MCYFYLFNIIFSFLSKYVAKIIPYVYKMTIYILFIFKIN